MVFRTPHYNLVMVMQSASKESRGRRIRFVDGIYETNDKAEIDFIKGSSSFGVTIFADEEKPKPKPKQQPKRSARLQEILDS
jgi:short subunit dehydrogenase-like uncharacterized protein